MHRILWEKCSDGDVRDHSYKADPFLCLFHGCKLMISDNIDVKNGIANGTCCSFDKAVLLPNAQVTPMNVHGRWVNSVDIKDEDHLVLRFDGMHEPLYQGTFKLRPRTKAFKVQFPHPTNDKAPRLDATIDLMHFPALLNYATTVHKLQGKSLDNLVVVDWSKTRNWAYVVLSRVRTLSGIFLSRPLPADIDFQPDPDYLSMMERLRQTILASPAVQ